MAFDRTKPADTDYISASAANLRENFRALAEDTRLYGTGAPESSAGQNGWRYVDTATGDEYLKVNGAWTKKTDLAALITRAVFESGSNSNGWYVRFCDGTQICGTSIVQEPASNAALQSVWTFPAEFYVPSGGSLFDNTAISATLGGTSEITTKLCKVGLLVSSIDPATSTYCKVYHYNGHTGPISVMAVMTAIGRWY